MTGPEASTGLGDRMDGDYQPPILTEPEGGPVPETPDLAEATKQEPEPAE